MLAANHTTTLKARNAALSVGRAAAAFATMPVPITLANQFGVRFSFTRPVCSTRGANIGSNTHKVNLDRTVL